MLRCQYYRDEMLKLPVPYRVPESLAGHLRSCVHCQKWHLQWSVLEKAIPEIPIPRTNGETKSRFLEQVRTATLNVPASIVVPSGPVVPLKRSASERYALWGSIVAALVILLLFIPRPQDATLTQRDRLPADPLLNDLVQVNVALAQANTAESRAEQLSQLAEKLHGQAKLLAKVSDANRMQSLAEMYQQVVRQGLLPQASELDRRSPQLQTIAEKLAVQANGLDRIMNESPPGSIPPLKSIAQLAQEGNERIRLLLHGSQP